MQCVPVCLKCVAVQKRNLAGFNGQKQSCISPLALTCVSRLIKLLQYFIWQMHMIVFLLLMVMIIIVMMIMIQDGPPVWPLWQWRKCPMKEASPFQFSTLIAMMIMMAVVVRTMPMIMMIIDFVDDNLVHSSRGEYTACTRWRRHEPPRHTWTCDLRWWWWCNQRLWWLGIISKSCLAMRGGDLVHLKIVSLWWEPRTLSVISSACKKYWSSFCFYWSLRWFWWSVANNMTPTSISF